MFKTGWLFEIYFSERLSKTERPAYTSFNIEKYLYIPVQDVSIYTVERNPNVTREKVQTAMIIVK